MKNYICYPMVDVPEMYIAHVTAPTGGLKPGEVVIVDQIDGTIPGNFTQFVATKPTTALLKNHRLGIVINGGFERLADGRRPAGQPNFAQYTYEAGETATVVILAPELTFYLSDDCLASPGVAKQHLYGANNSHQLVLNPARSADCVTNVLVVAKKSFRLGGTFANQFAGGNVCRVECEVVIA